MSKYSCYLKSQVGRVRIIRFTLFNELSYIYFYRFGKREFIVLVSIPCFVVGLPLTKFTCIQS